MAAGQHVLADPTDVGQRLLERGVGERRQDFRVQHAVLLVDEPVRFVVRPEKLDLRARDLSAHGVPSLPVTIEERVYQGVSTVWIVRDAAEGLRRIEEHSLPRENERMQKLYGRPSSLNKILTIRRDNPPDRTTVILVKERLGF